MISDYPLSSKSTTGICTFKIKSTKEILCVENVTLKIKSTKEILCVENVTLKIKSTTVICV